MSKYNRRSFIKIMGQSAAVACIGLSQKEALAQQEQAKSTGTKKRFKRITVEEHITWDEFTDYVSSFSAAPPPPTLPGEENPISTMTNGTRISTSNLGDVSNIELRLKDMDEAGIDMQVLSIRNPGVEEFDVSEGIKWARKINNKLAEVVHKYPTRFAGFSTIPWQDPTAAVVELERAVKELGLKGIKVDGTVKGEYLEAKKFWPIFKKAEELGAPIFIHVEDPRSSMKQFYNEFSQSEALPLGRDLDVCMQGARLIFSGLFEECPRLNFILGHMGAGLPFWARRISLGAQLKKTPEQYVKDNFYVATSGNFYEPALMCCHQAVGADHILFAVDFPTESNKEAVQMIESAPISDSDKEKIYHLNAERIFGIKA